MIYVVAAVGTDKRNAQLQHVCSCPLVAAARPYVARCSCPLVAATHSYIARCSCAFLVYRCMYIWTMCSCNICGAALLLQLRIPMLHILAALLLQLRIPMLHITAANSSCIAVYMYVRCAAATCAQLPSCCSYAFLCCTLQLRIPHASLHIYVNNVQLQHMHNITCLYLWHDTHRGRQEICRVQVRVSESWLT